MARPRKSSKRVSDLPDERIPIVDAVVEMVFARLREVGAAAKRSVRPKKAEVERSLTHHPGLAEQVADLLLSDLSRLSAKSVRKKKPRSKRKQGRIR
jgi:hypothetical protein